MTSHVEQQVQARIQAAKRREENMLRQRAELAAARRAGLAKRHAAKLRTQASRQQEASVPQPHGTLSADPTETHDRVTPGNSVKDGLSSATTDPSNLRGADSHAVVAQPPTTDASRRDIPTTAEAQA